MECHWRNKYVIAYEIYKMEECASGKQGDGNTEANETTKRYSQHDRPLVYLSKFVGFSQFLGVPTDMMG